MDFDKWSAQCPELEQDSHTTIVLGSAGSDEGFLDGSLDDESDLTIVQLPPLGLGGGPSIWELIRTPYVVAAVTIVVMIGKGFFDRIGGILAEKVIEKLKGQDLPSQIQIHYPETNLTLIVVIPKNISKDQTIRLNDIINEYLKCMDDGAYEIVHFSPKEGLLIPFYNH